MWLNKIDGNYYTTKRAAVSALRRLWREQPLKCPTCGGARVRATTARGKRADLPAEYLLCAECNHRDECVGWPFSPAADIVEVSPRDILTQLLRALRGKAVTADLALPDGVELRRRAPSDVAGGSTLNVLVRGELIGAVTTWTDPATHIERIVR